MPARAERTKRALAYLIFVVAAAVLVASHTPVGAALSMDSLAYISTASNILDGKGIVNDTYALSGPAVRSMTIWPPLYPAVLAVVTALAELSGTSVVSGIVVFNVFALIVSLFLVFRIASITASTTAGIIVAIAFALSSSLQLVFMYAWSEVLFIPLCLAAYLCLQRHLEKNGGQGHLTLYAMVLLLGLATYTRYVGLAFFSAAALALLLYGRGGPLERLRTTALATLAYIAILAPMLIRNLVISDALSGGERGSLDTSLPSDALTMGWGLYLEFLNLPRLPAAALVLATVASAVWLLRRSSDSTPRATQSFDASSIVVPFLFAACYLVFLLISRQLQVVDLDPRMLSVAIPFLLIGLLGVYQQLYVRTGSSLAVLPFLLPLAAFAVNSINTHTSIVESWRDLREPGAILGMPHRSMTGPPLDSLRNIKEYFSPANGDLVLTDVMRPSMVKYVLPKTDVRQMPDSPSEDSLALLEGLLGRKGIIIINTPAWSEALAKRLEGRARFYNIEDQAGGLHYNVIELPVDAP